MPKLTKKDVIVRATKIGWKLEEKKHKFSLTNSIKGFDTIVDEIFEADSLKEINAFMLGYEYSL